MGIVTVPLTGCDTRLPTTLAWVAGAPAPAATLVQQALLARAAPSL